MVQNYLKVHLFFFLAVFFLLFLVRLQNWPLLYVKMGFIFGDGPFLLDLGEWGGAGNGKVGGGGRLKEGAHLALEHQILIKKI